jgi:8-oxo-dGTP diphosphatase
VSEAVGRVTRISAYAVCVDREQRLLLCRIAPGSTAADDGRWTLPGGGLEFGEDPRDGALRELAEETGYIGELEELLTVDSWARRLLLADGTEADFHGIRILYRCRIVGGELRPEPDGSSDDARWFSADELGRIPIVDLVRVALDRIGVA